MTPRQAIDQAKTTLIDSRYLNSVLNSQGSVRVPVLPPMPSIAIIDREIEPTYEPALFAEFTIDAGNSLVAEFQGYKEFAA